MTTPQNPGSDSGSPYQPLVPQQSEPQPKQTGTDELEAVKCDDKDAKYKVISIVEDQVEPTDATDPCAVVADADSSYWEGKKGGTGRVLCLAKL